MSAKDFEIMQDVRCRIPEPTWVDDPYMKFIWPQEPISFSDWRSFEHPVETSYKTGTLQRKRFVEKGVSYFAWTHDGITPVFPVPMEEARS